MKYSTISISQESKNKFSTLKKKFAVKTDDETLNKICDFFIINNVSIRDFASMKADRTIADELIKHIDKRHNWITKNDQSLRTYIGKYSNDYWKDTLKNVLEIKEILIQNNFEKVEKILEVDKPIIENFEEKKESIQQNFSNEALEKLEEDYRKLLEKFKATNNKLERIKNNTEIESIGMVGKKKIIINLSVDEWQNMFI